MAQMEIIFDEQYKIFHLTNQYISYILGIEDGQILTHLYFGKKVSAYHGLRHLPRLDRGFSPNLPGDPGKTVRAYSKDVLPQEYAGNNTGDFRTAAIIIRSHDGARTTDFRYVTYKIIEGKPKLDQLPHTYVENDHEAKTLLIYLRDETLNTELELSYTIYADRPVIARSLRITNQSSEVQMIEKCASMQIDLPQENLEVISLPGAHVRERQIEREPLRTGVTEFSSRRGTSSHHMNPFIALVSPTTTETTGEALGIQLVYSGNHQFTLEKDYVAQTRILAGINEYGFEWQLNSQETFQTPEVLLVYSDTGLNGMSQAYHHLLRERLARGKFKFAERPIIINNWEATYFDFDADKINKILDEAASLSIEMFVLDDGWFGKRDDDFQSLGDWYEYAKKLQTGGGLVGLSQRVHDKGMQFGLWFEPEMISANSDLYRQHPDYALQVPNRSMTPSRDQYVLDFSRKEVVDNIYHQICQILDRVKIDYIKWDMNRHLTEVYSSAYSVMQQGEISHRYMLGVYDLAERLTQKYPNILFEGCSGGGGRFDAGMLYYFPQSWTSDNTDPVERLKIQYGTSLAYPVSSITAHVSASPNHQTKRQTTLKMRGDVAMAGVLGYELDLEALTVAEKQTIQEQIIAYKKYRSLVQYGEFYRLQSPFEDNETAWQFVSSDKSEVLLCCYRVLAEAQPTYSITKLTGLEASAIYIEEATGKQYYGDELMTLGLYNTSGQLGDFSSDVRFFYQDKENKS